MIEDAVVVILIADGGREGVTLGTAGPVPEVLAIVICWIGPKAEEGHKWVRDGGEFLVLHLFLPDVWDSPEEDGESGLATCLDGFIVLDKGEVKSFDILLWADETSHLVPVYGSEFEPLRFPSGKSRTMRKRIGNHKGTPIEKLLGG